MKNMSKKFNEERKTETYYKKAKKENYRSRASYKLLQLNKKFKVIRKGDQVVDFGAAPGGWSQVALEAIGEKGLVIGVDLQRIKPFEDTDNFIALKGDFTSKETMKRVVEILDGSADVILSDASPQLTGIKDVDQARSLLLVESVLDAGEKILKDNGVMLMKIFQGENFPRLLKDFKKRFKTVKTTKPPSSRKKSVEMYIFAKNYRKKR
jgi:23S rRNA (uridine2552-2'-O)-methyltransferase